MSYDKTLVAAKLRRWESYLANYRLPEWESIPDLGLYMEQVIVLLRQYLDYELKEEQFITAATINNYVRMKVMPEPQKKRYYRLHLAYLILIMTLKQGMSIQMISQLIPVGLSEEEVRKVYSRYADRHRAAAEYFVEQVRLAAAPMLDMEGSSAISTSETEELIIASAMIGGLSRLLTEKLVLLKDQRLEPAETEAPEVDPATEPKDAPEASATVESGTKEKEKPKEKPKEKEKSKEKTKEKAKEKGKDKSRDEPETSPAEDAPVVLETETGRRPELEL